MEEKCTIYCGKELQGRIIEGKIIAEDDWSVTIHGTDEKIKIPKKNIKHINYK